MRRLFRLFPRRISVSNLLLLTLVIALGLGWRLDAGKAKRDQRAAIHQDLVGERTATPRSMGYQSDLTLRSDGTFSKEQQYRDGSEIYDGEYAIHDDGSVTFRINQVESRWLLSSLLSTPPPPTKLDVESHCYCAVGQSGYLIVRETAWSAALRSTSPSGKELVWQTYERR